MVVESACLIEHYVFVFVLLLNKVLHITHLSHIASSYLLNDDLLSLLNLHFLTLGRKKIHVH